MTYDPGSIVGFTTEEFDGGINLIFYLVMALIPVNMAGSLYVLYRVLSTTFRDKPRKIPASLKLPFYIVFIDLLCSFTFIAEMIHLYIVRRPPEQPYAAILGGCLTFVIVSNFILVTQAAFFCWNRVVRKQPIDNGPFDVKLLAPAVVVPSIVITVLGSIGALGANNYVCFVRKEAGEAVLFLVICDLASMVALWIFYVWIMVEIFKVSRGKFLDTIISYRRSSSSSKSAFQLQYERYRGPVQTSQVESDAAGSENIKSGGSQLTIVEKQLVAKICMYMLGCFIQYLPGIPYALSYLFPSQPYPLYIVAILSINMGGIVNATALILNEGLGKIARSLDGHSTSYYPTSSAEASGNGRMQGYGSNVTGASSWGKVPSFKGILVNTQSESESEGPHPMYTVGEPRYQMQTQSLYPNASIAPRTDAPFKSGWGVGPGPSPYPNTFINGSQRAYPPPPPPPIPTQYHSEGFVTRTPSRKSSEYSASPTVVDVGSSAVSEAYANMARQQQQRQASQY
ncbi:hypothetical protein BJ742DRAFT_792268 [Cladochytrium replicatum]|nr:hypothetical protein BJ742DRAFT_792268 [Cladochytrium replicatum]